MGPYEGHKPHQKKSITIQRIAKRADVYPCIALEYVETADRARVKSNIQHVYSEQPTQISNIAEEMKQHGLSDLDLDSCEISDQWKNEM